MISCRKCRRPFIAFAVGCTPTNKADVALPPKKNTRISDWRIRVRAVMSYRWSDTYTTRPSREISQSFTSVSTSKGQTHLDLGFSEQDSLGLSVNPFAMSQGHISCPCTIPGEQQADSGRNHLGGVHA